MHSILNNFDKTFYKRAKIIGLLFIQLFFPLVVYSFIDTSHISPNTIYEDDFLDKEFHKERREELRDLMPDNSVAIFFSNSIKNRSNDVDFKFHQDPNFYYLTGFNEPHSLLLVFKSIQVIDGIDCNEILYVQPRDSIKELWVGARMGAVNAIQKLGITASYPNYKFAIHEFNFTSFSKVFYKDLEAGLKDDTRNRGDLYSLRKHVEMKQDTSFQNVDNHLLKEMMSSLREVKKEEEIKLIRKAIEITCMAQTSLMQRVSSEMTEYQAEALVEHVFKWEGAESPGFPSIVGSGANSCVLHYTENRKKFEESDLVVVDIGAEYHGYSADITRTFPVSGTFSEEQRIIYEIVLEAEEAGIKACIPGSKFWSANVAATNIIRQRLFDVGIIKERRDFRKYFMHGTSHYLGLDVHDVGLYGELEEGNVLTVEPGIYIPEGSDCDPKWWNIGIRIEDNILITKTGYEVLSKCVPKTIPEIEQIMRITSHYK